MDLLAADVSDEPGPEELHELLVRTFGNLTLTAGNPKLSNNPIHRKQDIYQASVLQMNREIAEARSWGQGAMPGPRRPTGKLSRPFVARPNRRSK